MPVPNRKSAPITETRPPIWVDGRQQPRFDLRAWMGVGHRLTRRWVAPRLVVLSQGLDRTAQDMRDGRWRIGTAWAGRGARFIPSCETIGAGIGGLAARLGEASTLLLPPPAGAEPATYPNLIRPDFGRRPDPARLSEPEENLRSAPAPRDSAAPAVPVQDPALSAIRAILHAPEPPQAPSGAARPVATPDPSPPSLFPGLAAGTAPHARRALAHAFAWSSLVLFLPVGLTQATLFHLNGGDLSDHD